MNKPVTISLAPGFLSTLTIVFVIFKLLGKLDWSWWMVLSPMWIPLAIAVAILLIVLILKLIVEFL